MLLTGLGMGRVQGKENGKRGGLENAGKEKPEGGSHRWAAEASGSSALRQHPRATAAAIGERDR
jgi:hypothetical protein